MADRYALRETRNGQYIDLVHTGDRPSAPALLRVPVRDGRSRLAWDLAHIVCRLLNEQAAAAHGEPQPTPTPAGRADGRQADPPESAIPSEQIEIMRHALGVGRGKAGWRNHFVVGPGATNFLQCEQLVNAGLMARLDGGPLFGGDYVYTVTPAGRIALGLPGDTEGAP